MTRFSRLRPCLAILLLTSLLAACAPAPAQNGPPATEETISISGAFALLPMVSLWAEEYQKINPGCVLTSRAAAPAKA